jgi:hypothetical protein
MMGMDRFVAEGIRAARRLVIAVVGLTVLLVGVALLVLPGPAFVVIPIGLGILAIEFEWARRLLRRARRLYEAAAPRARSRNRESSDAANRESDAVDGPDGPCTSGAAGAGRHSPPRSPATPGAGDQKP